MNNINQFGILSFLNFLTCFSLSLIFFIYGKNKLHKIWALFNLSVAGWAFFVTLAVTTNQPLVSYRLWLYAHTIGPYVAILYFHGISLFCKSNYKWPIGIIYLYGLIHNFINHYQDGYLMNNGVRYLFNSMYYIDIKSKVFLPVMAPWFYFAIFSIYKLYQYYRRNSQDKHAFFLLITGVIGYIGGSSTFLPMLGFHNFYPSTTILVAIYGLIFSYALFQHQILELKIFLRKSIIYSVFLLCVSLFYILFIFSIEKLFQTTIGYKSTLLSILSVLIIAVLFNPLKDKIQQVIDRIFFHGTLSEFAQENELLRQEVAQTDKLKAIATLASGMAHEVKNPLTAIKTFAEYLPKKLEEKEFLKKFSKIVGKEVDRIDNLVNQLLEFAKPTPLKLQKVSIHRLMNDTLNFLSSEFLKHKIQIQKEFNLPEGIQLHADPNQLRQALLNIFLNAIEAMSNGGTLSVSTDLRSSVNSSVVIGVADTGTGIDKKDLPHIFEPFFTKKEKGTGLGLAITKGIIEEHRGKIRVESTIGIGTKFTIELPLNRNE